MRHQQHIALLACHGTPGGVTHRCDAHQKLKNVRKGSRCRRARCGAGSRRPESNVDGDYGSCPHMPDDIAWQIVEEATVNMEGPIGKYRWEYARQ
jgi:hypothetical protein